MSNPLELYRKVLTEEFTRELQFLLDVSSGRATEKADFTDKLLSAVASKAGGILGELPGGEWLVSALEYALDWGNALRKQKKAAHAESQGHQIEAVHLRIVLDAVAMEAARRHQFLITEYLSQDPLAGVIPFAKTGVERMLEYVLRHRLNLQESQLLTGLMKGRSGRYVSGYHNTELKMGEVARKGKRYTAEGAYARSGFVDTTGRLYKVDERTNFLSSSKDPKYAYTHLPQAVIKEEAAIIQPDAVLSPTLKARLSNHKPRWLTITKTDITEYLKTIDSKSRNNPSLLSFMSEKRIHPIERLFYIGEDKDDWDLTSFDFQGADLSDGVFNHCIFSGSLDNTKFNRSYLRQADFSGVKQAHNASFNSAHLEFINAQGTDFTGSDLSQAHCEYANLEGSILLQCHTLGTLWAFAKLDGMKTDNLADIEKAQAEQVEVTRVLTLRLSAQQAQIEQLQNELKQLAKTIEERSTSSVTENSDSETDETEDEDNDTLKALQALNANLLKEQQARLAFERYCNTQLNELSTEAKASQAAFAAEASQLKETLAALKSQDEVFEGMLDKLTQDLAETNQQVSANTHDISTIKAHIEASEKELVSTLCSQSKALAALTDRVDKVDERLSHLEAAMGAQAAAKLLETENKTRAVIKHNYSQDNEIKGVFGEPTRMDEQGGYVNLQMIFTGKIEKKKDEAREDGEQRAGKDKPAADNPRDERVSSFEDLFGEKRVLELPDVFKPAKDVLKEGDRETLKLENENPEVAPNTLFIQGRAGIGKTTCVRYSANQWSQGKLWSDVEWLFVLKFRGLRTHTFEKFKGTQIPLWQWVYHNSALKQEGVASQSFSGQGVKEADFEAFWNNLIDTQADKVAFLLDGLDEAPEVHPCQEAFQALLTGKEYSSCKRIITSRPRTDNPLPKPRRDVEVVGLTNDNIEKYINGFFEAVPEKASTMIATLKAQPALWGMAHIPVTLNLMCGLFQDEGADLSKLQNMSGLYYQMESKLLVLAAKRLAPTLKAKGKPSIDDIDERMTQTQVTYARDYYRLHREIITQLASEGLQAEKIILPVEALDKLIEQAIADGKLPAEESKQFRAELLDIGLIKYTISDDESNSDDLEFMHLTFQEYCAAVAIASDVEQMSETDTQTATFVNDALFNPRYQIMFWLVMGLLKGKPKALGQLFERLIDETSPDRELIGESRLALLAGGVEEVMPMMSASQKKLTPYPIEGLNRKTQKKLFAVLLGRLNAWYVNFKSDKDTRISPESSHFLRVLRLSPKLSSQLALMPHNAVLSDLNSRYESSREAACNFVGKAKYSSTKMLPLLANRLRDKHLYVRDSAARAVGAIGEAAATPEILAGIGSCLRDEDKYVRRAAATAAGKIAGTLSITPSYVEAMLQQYSDKSNALPLFIMLSASARQALSISVIKVSNESEPSKPFVLRIVSSQQSLLCPLTARQAQALRHHIPKGIELLFCQPLGKAARSFEKHCQKRLPHIDRDPIMAERTDTRAHVFYDAASTPPGSASPRGMYSPPRAAAGPPKQQHVTPSVATRSHAKMSPPP